MNELRRVVALCRHDPEVGALSLLFCSCLYGILSILLGNVSAETDLSAIGAFTEYPFVAFGEDASQIGHLLVQLGFAYFATCAVAMAVAGVSLEIARRLGLLTGVRR